MPGHSQSAPCSRPWLAAMLLFIAPYGFAQDVFERFGERPYKGRVDYLVELPTGRSITQYGVGSVLLERSAPGKANLQLQSKVSGTATEAELTIPGFYDDTGWRGDPGEVQVSIDSDGRIKGGGTSD